MTASAVGAPDAVGGTTAGFRVHLAVFTGPFDLLLSLITNRELDLTQVALAEVTDEFVAYTAQLPEWDLDLASEFLVIAATLLSLKAARLLPDSHCEDTESIELLEARDLLFARLLQYRAFREVAASLAVRAAASARSLPRAVRLEPQFAALLPELVWQITGADLARAGAAAFARQPPVAVPLDHLHAPVVSVHEQAAIVAGQLRRARGAPLPFWTLVAGTTRQVVIARFLALLNLFAQDVVAFDQAAPLGDLLVRWQGPTEANCP